MLSILIIFPQYNLTADEIIFIDLDGDGIDDNIGDKNSDGIPDFPDVEIPMLNDTEITGGTGIFSSMPVTEVDVSDITPNSIMFGQYFFSIRNLSSNRGGFASSDSFGSDNGLNSGMSGGICVGPLCH